MKEVKKLIETMNLKKEIIQQRYEIILLNNSRSKTRIINNQPFEYSENNEFFSDEECSEILDGLQSANFFVKPHFNEINFILDTLNEAFYKNNKFVYNLSRNGNFIGKKSLIPAFCDLLSIPYTGSNALVTSFCRAKYMYTKYLELHGIRTPKSWVYTSDDQWLNHEKPNFGTRIVIKPLHESASIGLDTSSICYFTKDTENKFKESKKASLLLQEFIDGYECEVPLFIGDDIYVLDPVGISMDNKKNLGSNIITYERSFTDDYDFYALNRVFSKSIINTIKESSKKAAILLGLSNYGRIDYRIDTKGTPYLMDIATSPYTTKHSSFAFAFKELDVDYEYIYSTIIALAYTQFK
ncbi:hypothetical protein [Paenibacillus polymyxa]|uniref:hypothetical protein n=1 Tax=Paenibacillus TaxID=44249 RepID=UPI0020247D8C|nr:hypothetical protein [Paenibacillus polymyxa]MDY8048706.1 hypothetical protein [Paenibacillus polymyxa]URJ40503.3 hypothetical protein MF627_005171 [Paenibacillus polymyxa]